MTAAGMRPAKHSRAISDRLVVYVDADCGICAWVATWLGRLDLRRRLRIVPLQGAQPGPDVPSRDRLLEMLHARDAQGTWSTGATAFLQIAQRVPPLWGFALLGSIPALARLMERGYERIARDRHRLSQRLGLSECRLPTDPDLRAATRRDS
jgi:predicted DCC family thiol-disulfide oxidoreductase YuxK